MEMAFKKIRFFSFLTVFIYAFVSTIYADAVSGKIESIRPVADGQAEMVLVSGKEKRIIRLLPVTQVESLVPAKKIKSGAKIRWSEGSNRGGGRKGFRSPFSGIPKSVRKSMGLPEIPGTPDIPGRPEVPSVPKTPKIPKVKGSGSGAGPAGEEDQGEAAGSAKGRRKTQPPSQEPTEEEKSLFGRGDASKPLVSAGEGGVPVKDAGRKVLSVEATAKGIQINIEGPDGKQQQITLPPDKLVTQEFSLRELQSEMKIEVDVVQAGKVSVAEKVRVVE